MSDNNWNKIETAPKDGTVLLLHNFEAWRGPIRGYWEDEWVAETRPFTLGPHEIPDPTHWLPISGER